MLLRCIRAENRKLRGSAIWLVFFVVPLISCLYGTVNFLGNQGMLSFTWYDLWTQHTLFYALFFFAPMVGVYAAYLWRLEHLGPQLEPDHVCAGAAAVSVCGQALALAKLVVFTQGWVAFAVFAVRQGCGRGLPGWPPAQIFLWLFARRGGQFADRGAGAGAGDGDPQLCRAGAAGAGGRRVRHADRQQGRGPGPGCSGRIR